MPTLVGLIVLAGLALTGLLAYLGYLRAETRRSTIAEMSARIGALERENGQLRALVTTLHHDALRAERAEPLLAAQVENRITTHPLLREQFMKEL